MIKLFFAFIGIMLFPSMAFPALAQVNSKSEALVKRNYWHAKEKMEQMLAGTIPSSFEQAIYLLENAWLDNNLRYDDFHDVISYGVDNICSILSVNTYQPSIVNVQSFNDVLQQKRNCTGVYLEQARKNYAIYRYMTDSTYYVDSSAKTITSHWPYSYAAADPLGTGNWTNTQVSHLLSQGTGNCFAFVSLFRIYAERLRAETNICTAPGHVYISHKDEKGTKYNVEIASKSFPGTGTLSTLTYTTKSAIENGISLRELGLRQSVALCLVYLAKGYEAKLELQSDDGFMLSCAQTALQYDSLNLNALVLKSEILENWLLSTGKPVADLRMDSLFWVYERHLNHLFSLGYREIPLDMKNRLIRGWTHDTVTRLTQQHYVDANRTSGTKYASLSWGLFDERIAAKATERYGRTLFDTKSRHIKGFTQPDSLYNNYNFDPVLFAWNVDPLAHEFPSWSPYAAMGDNPIRNFDPDGRKFYNFNSNGDYTGVSHNNFFHNLFFKQGRVLNTDGSVSRQFRFADRSNDTRNIDNGNITKVVMVTDAELRLMVGRSGGFDYENKTANRGWGDRYDYIKEQGPAGGKMDFAYTQIPKVYPGKAAKNPLVEMDAHALFLPPSPKVTGEYAHNQMNFGNYLFGLSGQAQGFSLMELAYGAHYRALTQDGQDGYEPQLDSRDDQFSIRKGFEYGKTYRYDEKVYKVTPGKATPLQVTPSGN